ncbi:hypothetical protein BH10ACI2_BH10ACI2_24320 [soil metagenome]
MSYRLIFTSLFLGLNLACLSGCFETQVRTYSVPSNWQKIETDNFSLSAPETLKRLDVGGKDTSVWLFEDSTMTLSIEQGDLAGNLDELQQYYESSEISLTIDGRPTKCVYVDWDKPKLVSKAVNSDGTATEVEKTAKTKGLAVYFPDKKARFSVGAKPEVSSDVSMTILQSIKFK